MSIVKQITTAMVEFKIVTGIEPTKVYMSKETMEALVREVVPLEKYSYKFTTIGKNEIMGLMIDSHLQWPFNYVEVR
jgi:phosphoenolpyruvate synthase/pyruvate phosphate dikinase